MPGYDAPPPQRPFVIMNPRSGGGKVGRFDLVARAEALGAEVFLLEGPDVDVAAVARNAVARGADLLGVAGGDGTQALVAGVAAELDVPLLVISAGTRNHFALDLGLDRQDPSTCLAALTEDAVKLHVDLGSIAGRTFVNNASFGAYAARPEPGVPRGQDRYDARVLPDLFRGTRVPIWWRAPTACPRPPAGGPGQRQPLRDGGPGGPGRRARMDTGVLGMVAVTVDDARQAVRLLRHSSNGLIALRRGRSWSPPTCPRSPSAWTGRRCSCRPRCAAPCARRRCGSGSRARPGVPPPRAHWDLAALRRLAAPGQHAVSAGVGGTRPRWAAS